MTSPLPSRLTLLARPALLLALVSTGCGYNQSKYNTEMIDLTCARYDECDMLDFFGGTLETCQNYQQSFYQGAEDSGRDPCPNYDAKAAKDCVAAWEALTCAELTDGQLPAVCDSVCTAGSSAGQ